MRGTLLTSANGLFTTEQQWTVSPSCKGPAERVIVYHLADPESYEEPEDEHWPTMYSLLVLNVGYLAYPYGECGAMLVGMDGACCISAIDPSDNEDTGTFGITSGTHEFFEHETLHEITASFLKDSNHKNYCYLGHTDDNNVGDYLGMFYLQNGPCIDMTECRGHDLIFYNDTHCETELERFELTEDFQLIDTQMYGTINVTMVDVEDAEKHVGWVTFQPDYILVPVLKDAYENSALALWVLSVLIMCIALFKHVEHMIHAYSHIKLVAVLARVFWLIWVVANICYTYIVFTDMKMLFLCDTVIQVSLSFGSLFTVLHSTMFLFAAGNMRVWQKWVVGLAIAALHIGLCGGEYAYPALIVNQELGSDFIFAWGRYHDYWITFMYIWDILPAIFILYVLLKGKQYGFFKSINFIRKHDWQLFALFLIMIVLIVLYYTLQHIRKETDYLQNDRIALAVYSWVAFFEAQTSIVNVFIIDRIRVLMGVKSTKTWSRKKSMISKQDSFKDSFKESFKESQSTVGKSSKGILAKANPKIIVAAGIKEEEEEIQSPTSPMSPKIDRF